MGKIKRLVLDILKPHEPSIRVLAEKLSEIRGVDLVDVTMHDVDSKVEVAKVLIEGGDVDYEKIRDVIQDNAATIRGVDRVTTGRNSAATAAAAAAALVKPATPPAK